MLGAVGGVAGLAMGLVTIRFLVAPLAVKASGFELPFVVPFGALGLAAAAAMAVSLASAILPLRAVSRVDVPAAIGYE